MEQENIDVKHSGGDEWLVTVKGATTTRHRVRLTKADLDRLGQGKAAEELIQESFRFLLEREPNTSILPSFDLPIIGRYFPEYESEMGERMSRQG
jgi:tRNA U38,U39,U40 pseudouridine synthase TruA